MPTPDLRAYAADTMRSRGLEPHFATPALQEAEAARARGLPSHGDIRDLRRRTWFSIDNADTQDLDQLSVAEPLGGGAARLLVAIADVATFVATAGPMDTHAWANTTSVYTAAGVFPMLPETLSTDLTSLHEGQERLTVVVDMRVEADGSVTDVHLYAAVVVNHAKLIYDSTSAWLDGSAAAPPGIARTPGLAEQVRLHDAIASQLRKARSGRGALDVKTVSARPVFDRGVLVDLRPDEKGRANDLIADVMIATNSATARFLTQQHYPSLRRVLEAPRRWDRLVALAAEHGVALPVQPDAKALDHFLSARRRVDPQGFADLSLAVVKLLGSGEYVAASAGAASQGHFGLAVGDYAHSTAPNRRFSDLVTQRQVLAALRGDEPVYDHAALEDIASRCTLQEDNAAKVERQVLKAAAATLLQGRIGHAFDALVTGAAPKGTFVRITSPLIEGRLVRGMEGADVGDRLRVRLVGIDAQQGHIDFERAGP
ncbi:MAG: RNB domain-containing ribonuclease [Burkholderiales bacterium]|nr:RNB domain-containing ribonuclease [Burkholderiales bacterium]